MKAEDWLVTVNAVLEALPRTALRKSMLVGCKPSVICWG